MTSLAVLDLLAGIYQYELILLTRKSLVAEALVSLVLPVVCLAGGWLRHPARRILELMLIQTACSTCRSLSASSILEEWESVNTLCVLCFILYFVIPATGFLRNQFSRRSPHGIFQTCVFLALVFGWIVSAYPWRNSIDSSGRYLPFGSDAPLVVQLAYTCWFFLPMAFVFNPSLPGLTLRSEPCFGGSLPLLG